MTNYDIQISSKINRQLFGILNLDHCGLLFEIF